MKKYLDAGPMYEEDQAILLSDKHLVRLIAYYLPQFHPIPENDLWWGKGFTEWTNVTKARPQFPGHYQPHLPGELGFYDLRNPEVLYRQAALARRYGISGFCIHHYWFSGKGLLERPLQNLLNHPDIDIQFCLNWANENWTRGWDGANHEILIAQRYSPTDDIAFAESLERVLADPRYVRIDGRPVLMIYRPGVLPEPRATVERWRNHFVRAGFGNPYIVMPQAFGDSDPGRFGFDAAAGFPPHAHGFETRSIRQRYMRLTQPWYKGTVKSYDAMVRKATAQNSQNYTLLPGVCPSWDNHARRERGIVFHDATPAKYGQWLKASCESAITRNRPTERIVFVNAWNEWAEGAHLEPDRYFGYAYLVETARVLNRLPDVPEIGFAPRSTESQHQKQ